jgi:DNA-binding LacI/PurR family transcriptional regulator
LPTIKQLAHLAGVSHRVMSRLVSDLSRDGVVEVRRTKGIILYRQGMDPAAEVLAPQPAGCRWQRLKKQVHQDLMTGAFGRDQSLPPLKELINRYQVSYKTLRKAISALVESGALVAGRRKHRVAAPAITAKGNTIILFARGSDSGGIAYQPPRSLDNFRVIEQECLSYGVQLHYISCFAQEAGFTFHGRKGDSFSEAVDLDRVLGFAVWQMSLPATYVGELAAWLTRFRKPIAVYSETSAPPAITAPGRRFLRNFVIESDFEAGRRAGLFLLAHGHRRVCCFMEKSTMPWQSNRLAGIRQAFAEAGVEADIRGFDAGMTPDDEKQLAHTETLRSHVKTAAKECCTRYRASLTEDFTAVFFYRMFREQIALALEPSMRKVAQDPLITAWVGVNECVAVACLQFLRTTAVAVPQRVSVIGFDDTQEAGIHRLSSYSFNGPAIMHAMVESIVRPHSALLPGDPDIPIVVPGFMHERGTTGRAPT